MKLTREMKTGLIAIIVFIITFWGYNFLKGKNILTPSYTYYIEYENIEGVVESGTVYYKGYKIGRINQIDFNKYNHNKFTLQIVLEKNIQIPINSRIVAKQSSLIAPNKDLELIFSGEQAFHSVGDTLISEYDDGFMGMMDPIQEQLKKTISGINLTLTAMNEILDTNGQGDIKSTLASIKGMSNSLELMLSPNGDLGKSLKNLNSITGKLDEKKESLGSTIDNMAGITSSLDSANIGETIMSLDSTLLATQTILTKINNGEGTAGMLVNDSSLYMNLAASTANLDSLLIDLKEHPKRYVHFSLFGKSKQ